MKCAIIGLGQFGTGLALELARAGHEVSAVDNNTHPIAQVRDHVTVAARGDATAPAVLEELGIPEMDMVVVAIGEDFEASLIVTAALQKLGAKRLHVRVINDVHEHLLGLMGIESRIRAERMAAESLVRTLTHDRILRHFALDAEHGVAEVPVPPEWIGKRLADCGLRQDRRLNLITIRRADGEGEANDADPVIGVPPPDLAFRAGDHLVVFGKESDLERFANSLENGMAS